MSFFYWLYIFSCRFKSFFRKDRAKDFLRVTNVKSIVHGDRVGVRAEVDNAMNGMFGAFIQHCDEILGNAKNFFTLVIYSPANGLLEVTIQRPGQKSPTERIVELENLLEEKTVEVVVLKQQLEEALQAKPKMRLVRNKSRVA